MRYPACRSSRDVTRVTVAGARTKCDAILTAVEEFNARRRMAELMRHAGTCGDLTTVDALEVERRRD